MLTKGPATIAVVLDGRPAVDDITNLEAGVGHLSGIGGARHAKQQFALRLTPEL